MSSTERLLGAGSDAVEPEAGRPLRSASAHCGRSGWEPPLRWRWIIVVRSPWSGVTPGSTQLCTQGGILDRHRPVGVKDSNEELRPHIAHVGLRHSEQGRGNTRLDAERPAPHEEEAVAPGQPWGGDIILLCEGCIGDMVGTWEVIPQSIVSP